MAEFRGRHFGFLGLLFAGWVAARVVFVAFEASPPVPTSQAVERISQTPFEGVSDQVSIVASPLVCCTPLESRQGPLLRGNKVNLPFVTNRQITGSEGIAIRSVAAAPDTLFQRGEAVILSQPAQPLAPERRAQFYAYSFWRDGGQAGALNSGTQYGGSQSGFVATYALDRKQRLAVLLRGAIAHDNLREREVGVGLRWRPLQSIPFSFNAERRFRNGRSDAFATYVAGGVSEVALPMQFRLEAFGQAGVVSGKNAGPFFDFATRADRKLVQLGPTKISAGAGAWGGGQDDVRRVDVGPSVRTDVALGEVNFRVSADWRFRVAGNASPSDGPAITLSTSF